MEMIRKFFCKPSFTWQQGMTLIELMIAVVIVGVLAAITYPSYSNYAKEGYRKQAMTDMAKIQLYLEENYSHGYTATGIVNADKVCTTFCNVDNERYKIVIETTATSYEITATPKSTKGQNSDKCEGNTYTSLTLNEKGIRSPNACWK
ncbi:type IV pilin protein [Vibrio parahaemolyticus]|uniref:type IV pilin protein n=1 Tax=Vibrio parahaemolyticus TaxID=670 RepID=UPI00084B4A00|nr:type IV pilin protein [Vibrio parahaemolyticus]MDG2636821.1 type IV pilin protein [Vibrio parahaemolyticus]ODZ29374.1 prepilin-type N-terminal cleavage/methylation domain-containing protein [Vibrio parahaemolyticus]ODZ30356.1 prepilin-type N-terminal cleavage/methylation domain-containing protein [Vibrio parahaemolyticus]OHX58271.1 prepilin-type N-terminal cleavage/methylation domain-containing protein [Vibrio parahaemolyticus]HCH1218047.1 type IV pilin protein [Vibrio parahaemolyticus]